MNNTIRNIITLAAATLLTATTAGCKSSEQKEKEKGYDDRVFGEKFVSQDEMGDIQRMSHAQQASGARADGTLRAFNFDKGTLNSSGEQKLGLMIDDDDTNNPITVYVDVPQDDMAAARSEAISKYCKDRSISGEQLKIVQGPNPASYHPAAPGVATLKADAALGTTAVGTQTGEGGTAMK